MRFLFLLVMVVSMSEARVERLKISMPSVIPAEDGSIPLTVILDLRGMKAIDLPLEVYTVAKGDNPEELKKKYAPRPVNNRICPKCNEFTSSWWLTFRKKEGGLMINIPLDKKPGKWEHKYPPPGMSYGDGEDQGIELIYHAANALAPEEGKLNTYQLDLRNYLGSETDHLHHFKKIFVDEGNSLIAGKKPSDKLLFLGELNGFLESNVVEVKLK